MSTERPNRDAVTWNRCGRLSGRSAIASASAIRSVTGSASVASTTSGSRDGDVVEASGVDGDSIARTVNLDPRTVQLGFENCCAAETFECLGDAGRRLRQHRTDRLADLEGELLQRRLACGQRGGRDGGQGTAEHGRAPHRGGRDVGRLGDRVGHHPEQRPLAEFTAEQPAQERLLGVGRLAEQSGDQLGPSSLRSLARDRADLAEPGVDVEDG